MRGPFSPPMRMGVNARAFRARGAYPTFSDLMAAMRQEFVATESHWPQRSAPRDVQSESDSEESDDAPHLTALGASSLFPFSSITTSATSAASDPEIDRCAETNGELQRRRDALHLTREKALKKKMGGEAAELKMEIADSGGASAGEPVGGEKDEGSARKATSAAGDRAR